MKQRRVGVNLVLCLGIFGLVCGYWGNGAQGFPLATKTKGFRCRSRCRSISGQKHILPTSSRTATLPLSPLSTLPSSKAVFTPKLSRQPSWKGRSSRQVHALSATAQDVVDDDESSPETATTTKMDRVLSTVCLWTPLWTLLVSGAAVWKAAWCSRWVGHSLPVMQSAYAMLMLTMGLSMSKSDLKEARERPGVVGWNALLCFGAMPLLAVLVAHGLGLPSELRTGLVVLGCVGGGQASNLFALLAGGNVALSVVCTISTTLLGIVATPLLLQRWLGLAATGGGGMQVLASIGKLVLVPLAVGSGLARGFPQTLRKCSKYLPVLGVASTLVLVAGGSSNSVVATQAARSATTTAWTANSQSLPRVLLPSILLGLTGGGLAWGVAAHQHMEERSKRTLVVETLSKSPTLAYLLALQHFGVPASLVPAGAMVTLAVLGALVASFWSLRREE